MDQPILPIITVRSGSEKNALDESFAAELRSLWSRGTDGVTDLFGTIRATTAFLRICGKIRRYSRDSEKKRHRFTSVVAYIHTTSGMQVAHPAARRARDH
jgi:hypothetical protein